ncbi:hypothetical protein [Agarivorans sp. Alg241-V36]|uniref:hypothetical protein n=1 Tax=Agarivorans sp. Alg241-V36 TaxID=2305992 RepID=UPI0013D0EFCA|nr:hypothetical protein [Agarivorans sp. Alg241-V36]
MEKSLTQIHCDRCHCSTTTDQVNGWRVFLYNGLELPLRRTLGWCKQCEGLVTAEEFRDINLIIKEMGELVRQVSALEKTLKTNYWQRLLNRKLRRVRRRSVENLLTLGAELDVARQRANQAKCVCCGSLEVAVIDSSLNIIGQFWQRSNDKEVATGLVHPQCGGEFIARPIKKVKPTQFSHSSSLQPPEKNQPDNDQQSVA